MVIEIASFTLRGAALAQRLEAELCALGHRARAWTTERIAAEAGLPGFDGVGSWAQTHFNGSDALVFVGAAGIAVRAIAPHIRSKLTDPAVVSVDEAGRYAIALLSGHVGGANQLAAVVAEIAGGQAVVSTATDVNGVFAVDSWIARNGLSMRGAEHIKKISAALLEKTPVGFESEFPVQGGLPNGFQKGINTDCGLYIGIYKNRPYSNTLHAVPPALALGIGCRRGVSKEAVARAVNCALSDANLCLEAVFGAASIDLKRDEAGLNEWAGEFGIRVTYYTAEALNEVSGEFTASERVRSVTGTDNVCERAAVLLSDGGRLILRKTARDGVTVAAAVRNWIVRMDEEDKCGLR